jgi:hypothetical protein
MNKNFTHSPRTNIETGHINNQDYTVLVLDYLGGVAHQDDIKEVLRDWRPGLHFTYLFNGSTHPGYGFVGKNFYSTHSVLSSFGGSCGKRATYWFRAGKGLYSLTSLGHHRLRELKALMDK